MKGLSRLLAVGAVAGVAGCGIGVESFLDSEIGGEDFNGYLAREYQRLTELEVKRDMNWTHAQRIAVKGAAAANGETVLPWDPNNWNVDPADVGELSDARSRLIAALDGGGRETNPEACAKAQMHYDGWLEQSHDNDWGPGFVGVVQPDHVAEEKAGFNDAIALCEGRSIGAKNFTIYFGWDKYDLTSAAKAVIDEIAAFVSGSENAIAVRGHTDTSGSQAYNSSLSEQRADTVADALEAVGLGSVSTSFAGETELAVPTADGIREPLNRRVEVSIGE
ncbi:MAG: OmpA family protein [Pseudomonadota bacterium]